MYFSPKKAMPQLFRASLLLRVCSGYLPSTRPPVARIAQSMGLLVGLR